MSLRDFFASGNIEFVKYSMSGATTAPLETMTSGRVYATVNEANKFTWQDSPM